MNEDIMKILAYIAENMNDKFIFPDPELLIHYEN